MKSLVKTATPICLIDATNGREIHWNRPTVVVPSSFVQSRLSSGDLKLIASDLPDQASDEDFLKFWKDSEQKEELAVDAFLSQFKPEEDLSKEPEKVEPKAKAK